MVFLDRFEGFDFVIVGITIHQGHLLGRDEEEGGIMGHANELKDRLHFAQLYFAFKYLKPGGMILMRHHMSVRLVDFHLLALMLSLFDPDRLAITNVIQQERATAAEGNTTAIPPATTATPPPPTTNNSNNDNKTTKTMQDARSGTIPMVTLTPAIIATKPMAEFAIRKT